MKTILKFAVTMSFTVLLAACGQPTFDGSSEDAFDKSYLHMMEDMSFDEKDDFKRKTKLFYNLLKISPKGRGISEHELASLMMSMLDGKTLEEFNELMSL